ncbi:Os03g0568850 [Oryza sativa Japonica Group]|uniref:Os03g0568850 protein n=1 Tax=Oryza sativa subsp. japonica TaxID=39947 RepID=A0A0P0VZD0_ORYSJ|nr:hypothetical protein EE612_018498 [Oryza sativa]BAS84972.1 Os03g0568850 [Oryza sativa Japonica Group]
MVERLVGDELVDEEVVVLGDGVADEGDEVAVVDAADGVHLGAELLLPLPAPHLELLHRHAPPVAQRPHVHLPEPALADHFLLREPAGHRRQLIVREPRRRPGELVRARPARRRRRTVRRLVHFRRRHTCISCHVMPGHEPTSIHAWTLDRWTTTLTLRHDEGSPARQVHHLCRPPPPLPPVLDAQEQEHGRQRQEETGEGDTDEQPARHVAAPCSHRWSRRWWCAGGGGVRRALRRAGCS